jgi:hypothetical protein
MRYRETLPRLLTCALLFAATVAFGSKVGDTYAAVIAEKGDPKSQIQAGNVRVLNYPDATIKLRDDVVVSIKAAPAPSAPQNAAPPKAPGQPPTQAEQVAQAKRELTEATEQVKLIINQPVDTIPLTPELKAVVWNDWFHPGAGVPDFDNADIRKTQETAQYEKYAYITSTLVPGVAFRGADVEFNGATKYFYVDRSLPKKRLTEAEMLEVNRLYRIIGSCVRRLQLLGEPPQ